MKFSSYTKQIYALLVSQFLGALNDNAFKNALIILITFSLAASAGVSVNLFVILAGAIFILPFFLFSSTTGQICDKYPKDKVMQWTKLFEIIIMTGAAIALFNQNIYVLLFILFLLGLQSTIFGPAKYAVLPELLETKQLIKANGQLKGLTFIAILIGTILGGEMVRLNNGLMALSIITIAFAVIGWLLSLRIPKLTAKDPNLIINWNFISTTKATISAIGVFSKRDKLAEDKRAIATLITNISWFWFVGATYLAQLAPFAKDVLAGDERMVTMLLTAFAVGIGIGSFVCSKLSKRFPNINLVPLGLGLMVLFGVEIYIAAYLVTAGYIDNTLIYIGFIGVAFAAGVYVVPLETQLQIIAPNATRARIIGAMNIINALFMVMSALVLMVLSLVGFSIAGSFLLLSAVNAYLLFWHLKAANAKAQIN